MTDWVLLEKVQGEGPAEILKGMLEAQDIHVVATTASVGRALSIPGLSVVQILVPRDQEDRARELLEVFYEGVEAEDDEEE